MHGKPNVWSSLRLAGSDVGAGSRDNSTVDAEGARALARRIAAQEQAAESAATPAADGQTLQERLASGRVSPAGGQRRAQEILPPGVELRIYARDVEEQVVDGRSTYVDIWWCRARERGVWQAPYVFREVIRETVPAPEDASSARLRSLRPDSDGGFFRLLWRLVALEP